MSWLSSESHKLSQDIVIIAVFFKDELKEWAKGFFNKKAEEFVEHRIHQRRHENMKTIFAPLIALFEAIFKAHAPEIVAAAEVAATQTAEQQAAVDPKVQAAIAAYQAVQNLKVALQTPPTPAAGEPLPSGVQS